LHKCANVKRKIRTKRKRRRMMRKGGEDEDT
jgi:hypothetical protein